MAVSNLGTNAPNGTVGVSGFMRNSELSMYSPGIMSGFTPTMNGLSISPAAGSTNNYAVAVNSAGDREIVGINSNDMTSLQLSAPTTSGQSVVWSIVLYRDVTQTTTANNGVGSVQMVALQGAAATTNTETALTYPQIRAAIPNGQTAMCVVVADVHVSYGDNAIQDGDIDYWYALGGSYAITDKFTAATNNWRERFSAQIIGHSVLMNLWCSRTTTVTVSGNSSETIATGARSFRPKDWNIAGVYNDTVSPAYSQAANVVGFQSVTNRDSNGNILGVQVNMISLTGAKYTAGTVIMGSLIWDLAERS